jgi:pimeloyl-ACP methyl ester carboxylesterase
MGVHGLSDRVEAWRWEGGFERVGDHGIHVHERHGEGPVLLFLHGFPSSSFDFRHLLPLLPGRPFLTLDFLGFGLSDKPRGHGYGLAGQADLVEELAMRRFGGAEFFIVAHDMGTSVATELLARDMEGAGRLSLAGALLFNGSIVLDQATLTPSQKILRSRFGAVAARLSSERVFRQQFGSLFTDEHPLTPEEAADQWSLICHNGGRTMGHELIVYLEERVRLAGRWHGAIAGWDGPLSFIWGLQDPVATPAVLSALRELRPGVPVTELPDLGHYPQLEDPAQVARAIVDAVTVIHA